MTHLKTVKGLSLAAAALVLPILVIPPEAAAGDGTGDGSAAPAVKEEKAPLVYPGVDSIKGTGIAPLLKKAKKSNVNVVTWPGFQMLPSGGGSRVFVQLLKGAKSAQVEAPVRLDKAPFKTAAGALVYEFPKSVVLLSNNTNPIITTWFNTPVQKVKMKRFKKRVYMIVELKTPVQPLRETFDLFMDDLSFFFVEFEAGDFLPKVPVKEEKKPAPATPGGTLEPIPSDEEVNY